MESTWCAKAQGSIIRGKEGTVHLIPKFAGTGCECLVRAALRWKDAVLCRDSSEEIYSDL